MRVTGADGDVGVGRDRGTAKRAVIRAAPRPNHVGLPSPGLQVRVVGQETTVHERQGVDVGRQVPSIARSPATDRGTQDRVDPHHAGQIGAGTVVGQQRGHPGLTLTEHERFAAGHPRVSQDLGGHRLGLVTTKHHLDRRVQRGGDPGAELVGGGEQVESDPPGRQAIDQIDANTKAETMRFGVEHANVEPLGGGIGSEVAHAEHGQGEIVDPRTLRVVP